MLLHQVLKQHKKVIEAINKHPRRKWLTLFTNWGGEYSSQQSRKLFSEAGIPTYRTPEGAITAFMHMVEYRRNQKQLKETPALPLEIKNEHPASPSLY